MAEFGKLLLVKLA